jgi:hypothetical protein
MIVRFGTRVRVSHNNGLRIGARVEGRYAQTEGRSSGGGQVRTDGGKVFRWRAGAHRLLAGPRTEGRCTDGNRSGVRTARVRGGTCAGFCGRP